MSNLLNLSVINYEYNTNFESINDEELLKLSSKFCDENSIRLNTDNELYVYFKDVLKCVNH